MTVEIAATGVGFRVGEATLVADVDLELRAGELLAVVGPNGAGKTTLLRLLSGELPATEGEVTIGGAPIGRYSPTELALWRAMLGQGIPADIPFTVQAVVALGRHPHRRDPDNTRERDGTIVAAAMERTATAHLAERIFATLSGGEQTRVSLARVLAQDTPVVLLDEPTIALDVAHQERTMAEMRRHARNGRAVVAVLHDLNTAAAYADRIVLMADARIRAEGTPERVLRDDLLTSVYHQAMRVIPHPFRDCLLVLATEGDGGEQAGRRTPGLENGPAR